MADRDDELDELGRLWRDQPVEPDVIDAKEVLMKVQQQSRKFDRMILWRDVREALAGVAVLAWAAWSSWSEEGWLPKAGFAVLSVCLACVLVRMLRVRHRHADVAEDQPLVDRLEAEVRKVEAQAELLRTVRSWYIVPIAVGTTLWMLSRVPGSPMVRFDGLLLALASVLACGAVLFFVVGWGVWRLNQHALRNDLEPRIRELRDLLDQARAEQA